MHNIQGVPKKVSIRNFKSDLLGTSLISTLYNMCSVHRGDILEYIRGYHEYVGGYHEYIGVFNINQWLCSPTWLCRGYGTVGPGVCISGRFHHGLSGLSRCFWACWGAWLGAVWDYVLIWPVVFVLWRGLRFGVMGALDGVCPLF